ncbi:hypothetical protein TBLA_0J01780 [Henningerozyma blattae CBS 6284]|uniref:Increased recombination centers protein 22 n=1 Tax=Henningerozyma blattae (strain ATCC 34711 / CBS 6284 / DSM 70876 / NBRC 10599 / NRRL Y-10934 / UCD 77-7) TaxID=1071380 RepID=I2H9X0_HENB6|nr:hypothetical protein TBLA_0J01780 [Tetrapisispora blattae CBS 6284]CCH63172.1 hypothetical protein TBLA_0J01780 [Tetrapisispora blattae CBS 6284]
MKFAKFAAFALLNSFLVFAQEDVEINKDIDVDSSLPAEEVEAVEKPKYINLNVTYNVREKPDESVYSFLDFYNGDVMHLDYEVVSNEDELLTITGVQGQLLSYPDGNLAANISAGKIGPFELNLNDTAEFNQLVQLRLEEGRYYLAPSLLVVKNQEVMRVGTRPTLINVEAPPMSIFNPQFLSILITISALFGGAYYYVCYIKTPSKATKKQAAKTAKNLKGAATVDKSWLPDTYTSKK